MSTVLMLLVAVPAGCLFGLVASFLMTRASNFSAAANLVLGGLAVLVLAGILYLAVILAERWGIRLTLDARFLPTERTSPLVSVGATCEVS